MGLFVQFGLNTYCTAAHVQWCLLTGNQAVVGIEVACRALCFVPCVLYAGRLREVHNSHCYQHGFPSLEPQRVQTREPGCWFLLTSHGHLEAWHIPP